MFRMSLRGMKHMKMKDRKGRLVWAAMAVGAFGSWGTISAQGHPVAEAEVASLERRVVEPQRVVAPAYDGLVSPRPTAIVDDGWSAELPAPRQLVVVRRGGAQGAVRIEVFNARGEVVEHVEWTDDLGTMKPVSLDALVSGRYAVRVTNGERSEVVRFRKD